MPRRWLPLVLCCTAVLALPFPAPEETDSEESRKVLGSSVVTSVSVIMDLGNGTKKYYADAAGRPVPKPTGAALVGSPAELLNPDRYEFYTFDEAGDLVKRLMTLEEIQSIIANGETDVGEPGRPNYYHQNLPENVPAASSTVTDKVQQAAVATDVGELSSSVPGVQDVLISVQNVLKEELQASKNKTTQKPVPFPPTNSSGWNTLLPGIISSASSTPSPSTSPQSTEQSTTQKVTTAEKPTTNKDEVKTPTKKPVYSDKFGSESIDILTKVPASSMTSSKRPSFTTPAQTTTSATTTPTITRFTRITTTKTTTPPTTTTTAPRTTSTSPTTTTTSPTTTTTSPTTTTTSPTTTTTTPTTTTTSPTTTTTYPTTTTAAPTTTTPQATTTTTSPTTTTSTTTVPPSTTHVPSSVKLPSTTSPLINISSNQSTSKPIEENRIPASSLQVSSFVPKPETSDSAEPSMILVSSSSSSSHQITTVPTTDNFTTQATTVNSESLVAQNSQDAPLKVNIPIADTKPATEITSTTTNITLQSVPETNTFTTTTVRTVTTTQGSTEAVTSPSKLSTWSSVESETGAGSIQPSVTSKPSNTDLNKPLTEVPLIFKNESTTKNVQTTTTIPPKPPSTSKYATTSTKKPSLVSATTTTTKTAEQPVEPLKVASENLSHEDTAAAQAFINIFTVPDIEKITVSTSSSTTNKPVTTVKVQTSTYFTRRPTTTTTTTESNKILVSSSNSVTPNIIKTSTTKPQKPLRRPTTITTTPSPATSRKPIRTTVTTPRTTQSSATTTVPTRITTTVKEPETTKPPQFEENAMSTMELLKTRPTSSIRTSTTTSPSTRTSTTPSPSIRTTTTKQPSSTTIRSTTTKPPSNLSIRTTKRPQTSTTTTKKRPLISTTVTTKLPNDPTTTATTRPQDPTTTEKLLNDPENFLINAASGFVPSKINSPLESLPSTANGNLDMPPELAQSVLGVLSQVADVGAATTIDYGIIDPFVISSSTTKRSTTQGNKITAIRSTTTEVVPEVTKEMLKISTSNIISSSTAKTTRTTTTTKPSKATTQVDSNKQSSGKTESTTNRILSESRIQQKVSTPDIKTSVVTEISTTTNTQTTPTAVTNGIKKETATNNKTESTIATQATTASVFQEASTNRVTTSQKVEDNTVENKISSLNKSKDSLNNVKEKETPQKEQIKDESLSSSNKNNVLVSSSTENPISTSKLPSKEETEENTDTMLQEMDKVFGSKGITTTEPESATTLRTEQKASSESESTTLSSTSEVTTQQQTDVSEKDTEKKSELTRVESPSEINLVKYAIEETTTVTESTTNIQTEVTTTENIAVSSETTEISSQPSKVVESSTLQTKYKKEDQDVLEESIKNSVTARPVNQTTVDEVNAEVLTTEKTETEEDILRTTNINLETTTVAEDTTTDVMKFGERINGESSLDVKTVPSPVTTEASTTEKVASADKLEPIKLKTTEYTRIDTTKPTEQVSETTTVQQVRTEVEQTTTETGFDAESKIESENREDVRFEIETTSLRESDLQTTTYIPTSRNSLPEEEGTDPNVKLVLETTSKPSEVAVDRETEMSGLDVVQETTTVEVPEMSKIATLSSTSSAEPNQTTTTASPKKKFTTEAPKRRITTTDAPTRTTSTELPTTLAELLKVNEKIKDNKVKARPDDAQLQQSTVDLDPAPQENLGLEATSQYLSEDVRRFAELCNELAFRLWASVTSKGMTTSRSLILSPFAVTSLLAMVFLGARGPTSGQMNDILRLDDMVTFNPHLVFRNVTESVALSKPNGVATAAFVRELYSDKMRGKLLEFYKERVQQFYDGHVEEVNFNVIGDLVRRRTNLLIKRQTRGRIPEYLRGSNIMLRPPLAVFSANVFQTDCSQASTYGRDGEMYFTVMPAMRSRRLVPVPAVVWFNGFLAGYEPVLDATAVSIGTDDSIVSLIMVLPGQQGQQAPGDGLQRLEQRLIESSYRRGGWSRLLRSLLPRPGLELQIPRFSHRSLLNVTAPLQRMGLKDLFSAEHADLRGINGIKNDLHLSDIVQVNTFSTCAEDSIGSRHHVEVYPTSPQRSGREEMEEDAKREVPLFDDIDDLGLSSLPLALRPRQARLPDAPRLRFDRPFLYFIRHNPTGLLLHMGRFNPRILH